MKTKLSKEELAQFRTLMCLKERNRKSLEEVTRSYNRLYPPHLLKRIIGLGMSEGAMNRILYQLVKKRMVSTEHLSFTDRPLPRPTLFFCITKEGLQHLRKAHSEVPLA